MISYEQALSTILETAAPLAQRRVRLEHLLGFVLAEPVLARFELPRFDNSAVDGYGVKLDDIREAGENNPVRLKLTDTIAAGDPGELEIMPGTTAKIFTGAAVPPSCDAVVMREFCEENNGTVTFKRSAAAGENIRRRGEEFASGQEVLPRGIRVTPPVVGLLASFGYPSFPVHEKPRVALVITGDELIKPGLPLSPGQIYNSNAYALQAALTALGIEEFSCYHALDSKRSTRQNLSLALDHADVVITSGGVSVGDHDYVKEVMEELGVKTVFWRIAVKPGKPVYFGTLERSRKKPPRLVFGLPGNPVSVLVTYHQFVKPALLKIMGATETRPRTFSAFTKAALRKKAGRLDFVRGNLQSSEAGTLLVSPARGQESHMLSGLTLADCLIHFALQEELKESNSLIPVQLIDWYS